MTLQQRLAERLQGVKWADNYFYCLCPKHDDHRQSMLVYSDYFICKGCGFQGQLDRLEGFISLSPLKPYKAKKFSVLPRWKNWEQRYGDIEGIARVAHENVVMHRNDVYFRKRKIEQFIKQGYFGLLDGWIVIPVFDMNHQIVDIVVRALRQEGLKYVLRPYSQNEMRPMYSPDWNKVLKQDTVYVPFGIFDVWAFEAIGLPAMTGITGKAINPDQFNYFPTKKFIIVPDEGEERDAYHLANQLGWRGSVLRLDYSLGKDPDELRRNMTEEQWKKLFLNEWPLEVINADNTVNAL